MTIYLVRHGELKSNDVEKHFKYLILCRLDGAVNGYGT